MRHVHNLLSLSYLSDYMRSALSDLTKKKKHKEDRMFALIVERWQLIHQHKVSE